MEKHFSPFAAHYGESMTGRFSVVSYVSISDV
jgi:hypothetical protein